MRKIKTFILVIIISLTCCQTNDFRENVLSKLDDLPPPEIILYNEDYNESAYIHFDSISAKIDYLDSVNVNYGIIGFDISALNPANDSVLFERHINGYIFPKRIKDYIYKLKDGSYIRIDNVTISLFSETYSFPTDYKWKYFK